ncbi:hypothetical protein HMPREF1155_0563 [Slackia sp. CM382]|nr:hypothetical protein HMPREF1155_0563 [Slackia sp. CM382]
MIGCGLPATVIGSPAETIGTAARLSDMRGGAGSHRRNP